MGLISPANVARWADDLKLTISRAMDYPSEFSQGMLCTFDFHNSARKSTAAITQ
jgi:hypothetical protein